MAFIIKSNASQATDVLIKDLGFIVLNSGGTVTLTEAEAIENAVKSADLRAYLVDNAHGAGSSTLILNDGTSDIAQANAANFMETYALPKADAAFGVVKTNASAQVDQNVAFNGTATVTNLKAGSDINANSFKVTNLAPGTAATDAVNKAQLDSVAASGKVWKELVLHKNQLLDGASGAVRQAIAFWLAGQPAVNDTFIITDGTTTETFTFKASESVAFDVAIGGSVDATMANLVQAILDDSTLWDAVATDLLDQLNSRVVVIYRTAQTSASYTDRIYGSLATPANGQYVNFNGQSDYEYSTQSQLPSADPAVKTFGFGRIKSALVVNETHTVRDNDTVYTWNEDQDTWENTGANGVQAGAGLTKTGDVLAVDFGEVGDVQPLGSAIAAGSLDEAARADHVHTHGDRGGDPAGSQHDDDQIDVEATLARIGAPGLLSAVLAQINTNFGDAKYVGKPHGFSQTVQVPGSGTLYLKAAGGVLTSSVGKRMLRAGTIKAAAIQVDVVDASRAYKLSIMVNGVEVASVALPTSTLGAKNVALSGSYVADDLLSVAVVRTSGTGGSTFVNMDATVEVVEG